MDSACVWNSIYARSLEIDSAADGSQQSLQMLLNQLLSIAESIPRDVDPAEEFETYVVKKLCQSAGESIEKCLRQRATGFETN